MRERPVTCRSELARELFVAVLKSSRASSLLQVVYNARALWELACQRCRQFDMTAGPRCCHRGQARLPQRVEWCGSRALWELACQRCRQFDMTAGPRCCHRGQARLPQRVEWCGCPVPVGAGLPAMQTNRHDCRPAVLPSRASPTPTKGDLWELACQRWRLGHREQVWA